MKLPLPYTSERRFLLIQYLHSHGLLLLRSNKPDQQSKRIDILFRDVRAMEIRCWFDGIAIEETDKNFLANYPSQPLDLMEHGNRIFILKGKGWAGFILGGAVSYNEDDEMATALAARIHATGQLKRLMVVPREESQFYVVAGERRLAALQLLARQRQIAETFPVPCSVINAKPASAIQSSSTDQAKAGVDRSDRRRRFLHLRNHCPGLLTGSELVELQR